MKPLPKNCPYCKSPQWESSPYKFFSCGTKRISLFQRRTDECRRRERLKYVRDAFAEVLRNDKEDIKKWLTTLISKPTNDDPRS